MNTQHYRWSHNSLSYFYAVLALMPTEDKLHKFAKNPIIIRIRSDCTFRIIWLQYREVSAWLPMFLCGLVLPVYTTQSMYSFHRNNRSDEMKISCVHVCLFIHYQSPSQWLLHPLNTDSLSIYMQTLMCWKPLNVRQKTGWFQIENIS